MAKTITINENFILRTASIVLVVLLAASVITDGFVSTVAQECNGVEATMTADEAAEKAVNYINDYMMDAGFKATLISVGANGSLYEAEIEIGGENYPLYITMDGTMMFPSAISLDEIPEIPETVEIELAEASEDDDPAFGPEDAPVLIIAFSDYQCPYSAMGEETMKQVLEEYGDKVRYVFRDYPLGFHADAQKAAEASECADDQGKFWEYHDLLFENQGSLGVDSLKQYAADLELDATEFDECLDSGKYEEEVKKDMEDGSASGVSGTPAFFINGISLVGAQPFDSFKEIIDAELE